MTTVYMLWHEYEPEPDVDDEKILGVYSTQARAMEARDRFIVRPGFRDHPEGFFISPADLDQTWWTDGFARVKAWERPWED